MHIKRGVYAAGKEGGIIYPAHCLHLGFLWELKSPFILVLSEEKKATLKFWVHISLVLLIFQVVMGNIL